MSKRYIDAEAFLKSEITRCRCVPLVGSGSDDYKNLQELLEETPTADVVEVVRCRDCIFFSHDVPTRCCCDYDGSTVSETHYCSYGERKEQ